MLVQTEAESEGGGYQTHKHTDRDIYCGKPESTADSLDRWGIMGLLEGNGREGLRVLG